MNKEFSLDTDIRQRLLTGGFLIIGLREIALAVLVFLDGGKEAMTYVLSFILFVLALYYIIYAYTAKIVISPTHFTFQAPAQRISIPWQDVESIKRTRFLGVRFEALFAPKDKATIKGFPVSGKAVSINLFNFSDSWRESELGQQIKEYAPHLVE
jgi:hypothetical protein